MMHHVLLTELLKLKRTRITWLSWLVVTIMPLVGAGFMWIVMEPERAARLGLLGTKADFIGVAADCSGYFNFLLQTTGIGGLVLISVITAYVFGREYSEATVKNMLALPIARHWFVVAKLGIVLIWSGILAAWLVVEGLILCLLMGLQGYSASLAAAFAVDILLAVLVGWLLAPFVAWVAASGRGYLAPLGFAIFMLVIGMAIGATGWGKWFPWSIAPLFAGVAGPPTESLAPESVSILVVAFIVGVAGAIIHVRYADNTQ